MIADFVGLDGGRFLDMGRSQNYTQLIYFRTRRIAFFPHNNRALINAPVADVGVSVTHHSEHGWVVVRPVAERTIYIHAITAINSFNERACTQRIGVSESHSTKSACSFV